MNFIYMIELYPELFMLAIMTVLIIVRIVSQRVQKKNHRHSRLADASHEGHKTRLK